MGEITKVTISATTPQGAQYLYDLIVAQRITDGRPPLRFNFARILRFRVPTGGATVFIVDDPIAGLEGIKILAEEQEKDSSGTRMNNETLLGKYVYGVGGAAVLEIIQEY